MLVITVIVTSLLGSWCFIHAGLLFLRSVSPLSTQGLITCYSVCMDCPGPRVTTLKTANSRVQALLPQHGCQAGVAGAWHGGLRLLVGRWLLVVWPEEGAGAGVGVQGFTVASVRCKVHKYFKYLLTSIACPWELADCPALLLVCGVWGPLLLLTWVTW